MTSAAEPTAVAALRTAIHDLHEDVELLPIMAPLSRESITPKEYLDALKALYGFYRPMENYLYSAGLPLNCDMPVRPKSAALSRDIIALGVPPHEMSSLPMCVNLPQLLTANECIGALYVLEGATLGGRTILKRIAASLGENAEKATSFHGFHGDQLGPSWKRVQAYLTLRLDGDQAALKEATRGAQVTFRALYEWLLG